MFDSQQGKNFYLHGVHTGSGFNGVFPGDAAAGLRMNGAIPRLSHMASWHAQGLFFFSPFFCLEITAFALSSRLLHVL
jgi:hypothetical protein